MAVAVPAERRSTLEWRLWPPSESTRDVVAEKMVQHLVTCTPPIEKPEAVEVAKRIEQEAFTMAAQQQNGDTSADAAMVQVRAYAHRASQLLLDTLKAHRVKGIFHPSLRTRLRNGLRKEIDPSHKSRRP